MLTQYGFMVGIIISNYLVTIFFIIWAHKKEIKLLEGYLEVHSKDVQGIQTKTNKFEKVLERDGNNQFLSVQERASKDKMPSLGRSFKVKQYKNLNKKQLQRQLWLKIFTLFFLVYNSFWF
jgi:hypothetical protein